MPLLLTNVLFTGILLPPLLTNIVNTTSHFEPDSSTTKQSAMGAVTTLISFINLTIPLWGWLADRGTFRCCRSVFIVVGQLMAIGGLAISAITARGCYPSGASPPSPSRRPSQHSAPCPRWLLPPAP